MHPQRLGELQRERPERRVVHAHRQAHRRVDPAPEQGRPRTERLAAHAARLERGLDVVVEHVERRVVLPVVVPAPGRALVRRRIQRDDPGRFARVQGDVLRPLIGQGVRKVAVLARDDLGDEVAGPRGEPPRAVAEVAEVHDERQARQRVEHLPRLLGEAFVDAGLLEGGPHARVEHQRVDPDERLRELGLEGLAPGEDLYLPPLGRGLRRERQHALAHEHQPGDPGVDLRDERRAARHAQPHVLGGNLQAGGVELSVRAQREVVEPVDGVGSVERGDAPGSGPAPGLRLAGDLELPRLQPAAVAPLGEHLDGEAVAVAVRGVFHGREEARRDDGSGDPRAQRLVGELPGRRDVRLRGQQPQKAACVSRLDHRPQVGDERVEGGQGQRRLPRRRRGEKAQRRENEHGPLHTR